VGEFARVTRPGGVLVLGVPETERRTFKGMVFRHAPWPLIALAQRVVLRYPAPMRMHTMRTERLVDLLPSGRFVASDEYWAGDHWQHLRHYVVLDGQEEAGPAPATPRVPRRPSPSVPPPAARWDRSRPSARNRPTRPTSTARSPGTPWHNCVPTPLSEEGRSWTSVGGPATSQTHYVRPVPVACAWTPTPTRCVCTAGRPTHTASREAPWSCRCVRAPWTCVFPPTSWNTSPTGSGWPTRWCG